jgi:ubiquitin-conjugating enzyme E2 N
MSAPNPDDPLDNNVADVWKKDEAKALLTAREFTKNFAAKKE